MFLLILLEIRINIATLMNGYLRLYSSITCIYTLI